VIETKETGMVWAIIVGLVVGAIARFVMPGKDPGGVLITILLGIAGSITANFIGTQMGAYGQGEPAGIFASILGAVVLLAIYRAVSGKKQRTLHQS
jgi:uncharacterized membrane protein YeaQ/YmgE (transglycosylase-associated protein family)